MKTLKFLAVLWIVFCFATSIAQSQAFVIQDQTRVLYTDYGIYYPPVDSYAVLTPSGNLLISATYQLSLEDPLVPDRGVNKVPVWGWTNGDDLVIWNGEPYDFLDSEMIITSAGKARLIYHLKHTDYYPPYENLP